MQQPPAQLSNAQELALLVRTANGDRTAFETLYLGYHPRLARFLTRLTRRHDLAEEIINDTLWVVWCKAGQFRGESQVSTWIMGIAYRRAMKSLRRDRSAAAVPLNLNGDTAALTTEEPQRTAELREWLGLALAALPIEQRVVLELTYYLGHSCEEVAAIMDCPVNTVKTRMFHARRKLRESLPRLDAQPAGSRR